MANPGDGLFSDYTADVTHGGKFIRYGMHGSLFEVTAKYRPPIVEIGRGAYGMVCSAINTETNEKVAIKKIANAFDDHMNAKRTLREIKILRYLDHENIIALTDVIPPPSRREFNDVYIVTELMETDLNQIIQSNQGLSEDHYQYILYQLLRGLKYIHSANIIHRDLKPSNLLLSAFCDLKICDFGLARPKTNDQFMTEYVVSRWYRAPELLLSSSDYTSAIDVWSVGCIYMELMIKKPLFAGKDHMNQMRLVTELLGTPTEGDLGFVQNEETKRFLRQLPLRPRQSLRQLYPQVHPLAIDLVDKMLKFDPAKRITVEEALAHPYLEGLHDETDEPICSRPFSFEFETAHLSEEQMKDMVYQEALSFNPGMA